jgi:hypothetical protein
VSNLLDHSLIKRLHRESKITLADLLDRKLFIEPPAEPCGHIEPGAWFLHYQEDLPQTEKKRLSEAVKLNPRLIRAAALVVASKAGKLSKQQKYMAFDFTRYVEAHEYELAQLVRRSEGGKNAAEKRAEKAAGNIATAADHWRKLEQQERPEQERCAIISARMGHKVDTIRGWIKQAGLR